MQEDKYKYKQTKLNNFSEYQGDFNNLLTTCNKSKKTFSTLKTRLRI